MHRSSRRPIVAVILALATFLGLTTLTACSGTEPADQSSGQSAGSSTPMSADGPTPGASSTTSAADGKPATPTATASATPGTARGTVRVKRTLSTGLDSPWGLARLPGGDVLVTSRDTGQISRISLGSGARTMIGRVAPATSNGDTGGEAGLLGLAVSPRFADDHQLFVYYSTDDDNRIARLTYRPDLPRRRQLSEPTVILDGIPHGQIHNGGRLAFGPDGLLYASTGETGNPSLAQDRTSLGGKILRMTPDGDPAPGNPDPDSVVWTWGHRNVQGLAWDPAGRLWASEFGDHTADELNLIKRGHNYGWPDTQGRTDDKRFTSPVAQWGTDEDSPSGIAYAAGSIWMAALQGERLWRIPLDGTEPVADPQDFLTSEYGRLRSVLALDDHTLLVTTSNTDGRGSAQKGDDKILELTVS